MLQAGPFSCILITVHWWKPRVVDSKHFGELSEWSIVQHSKCCVLNRTQGSNPWLSAITKKTPVRRLFDYRRNPGDPGHRKILSGCSCEDPWLSAIWYISAVPRLHFQGAIFGKIPLISIGSDEAVYQDLDFTHDFLVTFFKKYVIFNDKMLKVNA